MAGIQRTARSQPGRLAGRSHSRVCCAGNNCPATPAGRLRSHFRPPQPPKTGCRGQKRSGWPRMRSWIASGDYGTFGSSTCGSNRPKLPVRPPDERAIRLASDPGTRCFCLTGPGHLPPAICHSTLHELPDWCLASFPQRLPSRFACCARPVWSVNRAGIDEQRLTIWTGAGTLWASDRGLQLVLIAELVRILSRRGIFPAFTIR